MSEIKVLSTHSLNGIGSDEMNELQGIIDIQEKRLARVANKTRGVSEEEKLEAYGTRYLIGNLLMIVEDPEEKGHVKIMAMKELKDLLKLNSSYDNDLKKAKARSLEEGTDVKKKLLDLNSGNVLDFASEFE
jgi:hypothetical protein